VTIDPGRAPRNPVATAELGGIVAKPPHVALLTNGLQPYIVGGMQRHSRMLAIELARAGSRVELFHVVNNSETFEKAAGLEGFPPDVLDAIVSHVVRWPRRGKLPGHYIRESEEFSRALLGVFHAKGTKADFIYAQGLTGKAFLDARDSGDRSMPPIGVNLHGYEPFQVAANVRSVLENWMLRGPVADITRRADWVFSFPGKIREVVETRLGVPSSRVIDTWNGIDGEWIVDAPPPPGPKRRFVFVGRHQRRKGFPELMATIDSLPEGMAEFHIVGPIPESLRRRRSDVIYHGQLSDNESLQRVLDAADVLVCPSFAEGMPTVVLEAMARGLAIIATDVGATSEWVGPRNGWLLDMPAVPLLKQAISEAASLPAADLLKLRQTSLSMAKKYTWDRIGLTTLLQIKACLQGTGRPGIDDV